MPVRYYFLAVDDDINLVRDWFADVQEEMTVQENNDRVVYYFRGMADKPLPNTEEIDQAKTPLVFLFKPKRQLGTLWTDGVVEFTPSPLKAQFPELHKISQSFAKWIKQFDLVFSQKHGGTSEWNYYLEGGIMNFGSELFALPRAMEALRSGHYFVHHRDTPTRLETLGRTLRLRGYDVANS